MASYYLHKRLRPSYPIDRYDEEITRNSPNELASIDKNVNSPSITVDLDLMKKGGYKSVVDRNAYNTYDRITKEDFYNYLSVSLDALKTFRAKESEIYFDKPYKSRYEIVQYSSDPKRKFRFHIEVNFDLEWGEVQVYCDSSFTRRRHYQQNATPVSEELFKYIQFKTLEYLADDLNYLKNFREYQKVVDLSYKGKIKPVLPPGNIDINPLITSLSNQIRELESRLLNNDTDKKATREKIRGRIEGLKSAIFEINNFFADQT